MPIASAISTLDLLYLVLSMGVLVLVVLLSVLIIHLVLVLRDFRKISNTAGDITEKFHTMILTPVSFVSKISENLAPYVEEFVKKQFEKKPKKK
jgi:cell shape-determining protein MreC